MHNQTIKSRRGRAASRSIHTGVISSSLSFAPEEPLKSPQEMLPQSFAVQAKLCCVALIAGDRRAHVVSLVGPPRDPSRNPDRRTPPHSRPRGRLLSHPRQPDPRLRQPPRPYRRRQLVWLRDHPVRKAPLVWKGCSRSLPSVNSETQQEASRFDLTEPSATSIPPTPPTSSTSSSTL